MGLFMAQEFGLEVPSGWLDATLNVLEYKRPQGVIRVGLSRTARGKKDLAAMTEERVQDLRRKLPFFELAGRRERQVAGLSCVELLVSYEESSQRIYQRTLAFVLDHRLLVLGVTGPEALREEMDAIYERATGTLALRRGRPEG